MKKRILFLLILLAACSSLMWAQRVQKVSVPDGPMLFRVYDGTVDGHKFNADQDGYYPGKRLPVGAESPENAALTVLRDVDVYVVSRSFADTLLTWQRTNRMDPLAQKDDSIMLSQFYDYYDEYGYKLSRHADGSYDLRQAFAKARQLYMKFRDVWNFWGDGPTDFELIVHHRGEAPSGSNVQNAAERHRIRDIMRYYVDGSTPGVVCPIFYDGKVTGVETSYEVSVKPQYIKRVVTLGNEIAFDEHVELAGKTDERILVERYVETCTFDEDYEALMKRQEHRLSGEELNKYGLLLRRVLKSVLASNYRRDNWPTYVLPGYDFELAMKRRTLFDINRDTLYQARLATEHVFGYNTASLSQMMNDSLLGEHARHRLYLLPDTLKLDQRVSYRMPDINRYYHMKHITYMQDFAHVEGVENEECPCYRTSDLRFLSLAAQYARIDCPPTLPGNEVVETYQPISPSKVFHAIQKEARLVFDKAKVTIDMKLENNRSELDSLKAITHDILADQEAHNHIDTIAVVAISSPEGVSWESNMDYSRRRAQSVNHWIQSNCVGTQTACAVSQDSVATWLDVADIVESFGLSYVEEANRIREAVGNDDPRNTAAQQRRIGYLAGSSPAIDRALQQLRKVQVNFIYKAQQEPTAESVMVSYRRGANREKFSAFYYYTLLMSDSLKYEEKLHLAREVVNRPYLPGDDYLRTHYADNEMIQPEQWFDLIRPVAANLLAIESIRQREYDLNILAPYLSPDARINTTVFDINENRPFKYINADFAVYNQLAMLLGKGDEASLNEADVYLQMFANARVSEEFRNKYRPQDLIDLVMLYTSPNLLYDIELAERIKRTNIINYYVIELSQLHEKYLYQTGQIYSQEIKDQIVSLLNRLPELSEVEEYEREKSYFEAVVCGRYADFIGVDEERAGASMEEAQELKDQYIDRAVDALVTLFQTDADMISFCQGNRYIRGIYRNPLYKSQGVDYYLEAVAKYCEAN